jgi:hypothetical protein
MGRGMLLAAAVAAGCLDAPPASTTGEPPPCAAFGEWKDPLAVPGLSEVEGTSPTVDGDGHFLVWETPGPDNDLADAVGDAAMFELSADSLVAELNTIDPERNPTLAASGLTIWFTRDTQDATRLFASQRELDTDPFPPAVEVDGLEVAPEAPDVWDDGHEMFFSVLGDDFDLAHAACETERTCSYEGLLPGLEQGLDDLYPTIRSDGLELIYRSVSLDGLMTATRASAEDDFELGELLPFPGYDPELTADGRTLYFAIDGLLYLSTRSCSE